MARLTLCFIMIVLFVIYVHINECKPIFIPAAFLEQQAWPKDIGFPSDRLEQSNVPFGSEQELMEADRSKRNCLTYPGQRFHQISKWMCW